MCLVHISTIISTQRINGSFMPFSDFLDIFGRTFRLFYWCDSSVEALRYGGPLPYPHRCSSAMSPLEVTGQEHGTNLAANRGANHLKMPFPDCLVSIWISVFLCHPPLSTFCCILHGYWTWSTVKSALQFDPLFFWILMLVCFNLLACLSFRLFVLLLNTY